MIAILEPTAALVRVDLPAFGRPMRATKPLFVSASDMRVGSVTLFRFVLVKEAAHECLGQ